MNKLYERSVQARVRQSKFTLVFLLVVCLIWLFYINKNNANKNELNTRFRPRFFKSHNFKLSNNMLDFFNIDDNDASKVIWSHAVNSKDKLRQALTDNTMVLEADILLVENKHSEPIMAHPPLTDSDITFSEWLETSISTRKALKLDFKTANAIEPCLKLLKSKEALINVPVILNADIFKCKRAAEVKIDPSYFLTKSLEYYPKGILSIGWTTYNDTTMVSNYTWDDVYQSYEMLKKTNILNRKTEITFAIRLQWSLGSLFRLIWLQKFTQSTFTVWSHETDELGSIEKIYLIRKYFPIELVYYDLPKIQDEFHKSKLYEKDSLEKILLNSNDPLVKSYLNEVQFEPSLWSKSSDESILECNYSALMITNGAKYTSNKQYKAQDNKVIYEVYGSFEVFANTQFNQTESNKLSNTNNETLSNDSDDRDANIAVESKISDNVSCVKISLRTSPDQIDESNVNLNPPGSINFYIYTSGLVKIYVGNKMEQEANLQPSNKFEFYITDVGESNDVHFDLNSFDSSIDQTKYSLQMLVNAKYVENQMFYVTQTLIGDRYGIGIDALKVSDEISDPQDRDSIENQNSDK